MYLFIALFILLLSTSMCLNQDINLYRKFNSTRFSIIKKIKLKRLDRYQLSLFRSFFCFSFWLWNRIPHSSVFFFLLPYKKRGKIDWAEFGNYYFDRGGSIDQFIYLFIYFTCNNDPSGSGGLLYFACQSMYGTTIVGLVAVTWTRFVDVQCPTRRHSVFPS